MLGDDSDDDPVSSFERDEARQREKEEAAKRLEEGKHRHQLLVNRFYVEMAKHKVDKAWTGWHSPASGRLLITKVELTLDAHGKIAAVAKSSTSNSSEPEDKSVKECLDSLDLGTLPPGVDTIDLFWTFMSDGNLNLVECTDSPEANAYSTELLGGRLSPKGDGIIAPDASISNAVSMNVSAQGAVDSEPYISDLQRRVKKAWFPPENKESRRIVVVFKIHRGGNISDLRLDRSCGIAEADQATLKAVENAAPFKALPVAAKDDADIQCTFYYNVFNGGHNRSVLSSDNRSH